MNDEERSQWIDNDEGLYNWCRAWCRENKKSKREFMKENREAIDRCINNVTSGRQPAHYLEYAPRFIDRS